MCKKIDLNLHFTLTPYFWTMLFLLFMLVLPNLAWAQEGYNVNNGYACPGMDVLKERYQGDCFPCEIVNVLLASFMRAASKVYDVSKEAGNKLLLLGSVLWVAFWALQRISTFAKQEPSSMVNELIVFFGKVLVAYCFINAGIGTLVSYAINPILGAGAEFGTAMLLETENIDISSAPKAENQYSGPTDIVSKSVMDRILKLSEAVSNEVATNFVIGSGLTCFSIQNGLHIVVPDVINIHIPDIWLWLCGAAIWCVGFMLVLAVCYYLIDIPFKIGFAIIALPVVIGLWPFKITAGKLKSIIGIALNAAFTFLFLALSSSYAIRLISQAFSSESSFEVDGQTFSGKEALFKAFELDDEEYVQSLFDFTGPAFLIILFCYIYGFKMISSITNDFPSKFDTGMTSAAGSPLHHMATAATAWAGNKVAAPFKTAAGIVAFQAGKAATTATKAATNVGLGAAGYTIGAANKFVGKTINQATSGWVNRQTKAKAAADSLDKRNALNQAGVTTTLQGKMDKFGASIGLGLAKSINNLGKTIENSGDTLMAPAKTTARNIADAASSSGKEWLGGVKDIGNALTETVASVTPNKLASKMGGVGQHILQTKEAMKEQAHQDFSNSVSQLGDAARKFVPKETFSKQNLYSSLASMQNFVAEARSGVLAGKIAAFGKSKIKYMTSGQFLKPIKESYVESRNKIAQDIERSKQDRVRFSDVGANFKRNIGMAQTDLSMAKAETKRNSFAQNWQELKQTVSDFKNDVSNDTGIQNKYAAAAVTLSGIGLGIAAARHLSKNTKEGISYVGNAVVDGALSAIGKGVVRPAIALGASLGKTAEGTLSSAFHLTSDSILTGIGVAKTVLAPVSNITRAATYSAYAIGDTGMAMAAAAGNTVSAIGGHLNVLYQYTKYVSHPVGAVVGLPFRGAGKVLGFAAKTVDSTLGVGIQTTRKVVQGANTLGHGANVLYHGLKDRTVAGQFVTKTFKTGSKTLALAAKTLKLGRNIVLAAAGENAHPSQKENEAERREKNRIFREKQKERRKQEAQRRKEEERRKAREERQREEDELWQQEFAANGSDKSQTTRKPMPDNRNRPPRQNQQPPSRSGTDNKPRQENKPSSSPDSGKK